MASKKKSGWGEDVKFNSKTSKSSGKLSSKPESASRAGATGKGTSGKGFKFNSKASQQPKKDKHQKLDPIRNEFRSLVNRANARISQLANSEEGLAGSPIFIKLFGEEGVKEGAKFSLDDKKRFRDIRREVNRVNEFLSAEDSIPEGAKMASKASKAIAEHQISFQTQNIDEEGHRFSNLDQDRIKFAMKIYRQITDSEYLAIGKGKGQFGSDNLINLIYDEVDKYDPNLPEEKINKIEEQAMQYAYDVLDAFKRNTLMGFLSGNPEPSHDTNIVQELKKSQSADEFFERNPWLRGDNF